MTVTISVTNEDELGTVTLSSTQPAVGLELTATLDDPDGVVAGSVNWQWARETEAGVYEDISGATSASYTPVEADQGGHLQANATYADVEGTGKNVAGRSDNAVPSAAQTLLEQYDAR